MFNIDYFFIVFLTCGWLNPQIQKLRMWRANCVLRLTSGFITKPAKNQKQTSLGKLSLVVKTVS